MTLHLRFANRVEPLLEDLSGTLDTLWTDLGTPPDLVVPSPAIAKWLKLRLCERRRALVNLPTPTLEGFLWKALQTPEDRILLRAPALAQAMVPLLEQDLLLDPRYQRVGEFLRTPDGDIDPRRRLQLAQEIARLFLEYEYNRPSVWANGKWSVPGLDRHWPDRVYFHPEAESPTEAWQRDFYGKVFSPSGTVAMRGYRTLPARHREARESGWTPSGGPILLFLIDKVSHFHRNLLMELSQGREIHLFMQNPCSEFWEDLDTRRRVRSRRDVRFPAFAPEDYGRGELPARVYPEGSSTTTQDPVLLSRWGHTARENIALWSQASDYAFDFLVAPPLDGNRDPSLLSVLQHSLLERHPGPGIRPLELPDGRVLATPLPADPSLRLLASPERGREMETIRDQVLDWLAEDPSRSPADCLVLLADPTRHRTEIHRVFGGLLPGEPGWIPWAMLGEPGRESRFARGVEALGNLLLRGMDRAGLFALLRNPLCQGRLGIPSETIASWERWAEGAGMVRGWDAQDRVRRGDARGWDTHTFRAGILRLYSSRLAAGGLCWGLATAAPESLTPGWRDFDSADPASLDAFVEVLERLHSDLESFHRELPGRGAQESSRAFVELCLSWLDAAGAPEESQISRTWMEAMDQMLLQKGRRDPLGLDELVDTARSFLPEEMPGSSRVFSGPLTFAPLRIGSLVPHGLVVIAGLDSDVFPRPSRQTSLDLLGSRRLVGDADPTQDDRHAFLSAILSARDRLVLAWRSEDLQKDRELEPSSVVQELLSTLPCFATGVAPHAVRLLAREHGIHRKGLAPWNGASWDPVDAARPAPPTPDSVWNTFPEAGDGDSGPSRRDLSQIRRYLENPFAHRLRDVLGFEDEDDADLSAREREPLDIDALDNSRLRRRIFEQIVQIVWNGDPRTSDQVVDRQLSRFSWEGGSPEGELLVHELSRMKAWAKGIEAALSSLRDSCPGKALADSDLSLGVAGIDPVLHFETPGGPIELVGTIPLVVVSGEAPLVLVLSRFKDDRSLAVDPIRRLDGWLQVAALRQAGFPGARVAFLSRELPRKPSAESWVQVLSPSPSSLDGWLPRILEDLQAGRHEFLPARHILGTSPTLSAVREAIEESSWADELEMLFRPELPGESLSDDEHFSALVERRLGPLRAGTGLGEAEDEDA
ncbi:MAG: exodeoxyribonuclease V subunit gamma [Fibrobacteria bacterium]|nr:exodeoxyribonuclease V subunit gamma [Fibrobacteria bacterium]